MGAGAGACEYWGNLFLPTYLSYYLFFGFCQRVIIVYQVLGDFLLIVSFVFNAFRDLYFSILSQRPIKARF